MSTPSSTHLRSLATRCYVGVSTRLKLATRRDIERRVQDLLNFYKREYRYAVFAGERSYHVKNLLFTQSFVESDKLGCFVVDGCELDL